MLFFFLGQLNIAPATRACQIAGNDSQRHSYRSLLMYTHLKSLNLFMHNCCYTFYIKLSVCEVYVIYNTEYGNNNKCRLFRQKMQTF